MYSTSIGLLRLFSICASLNHLFSFTFSSWWQRFVFGLALFVVVKVSAFRGNSPHNNY